MRSVCTLRGGVAVAALFGLGLSVFLFLDIFVLSALVLILVFLSAELIWLELVIRNPSRWFELSRNDVEERKEKKGLVTASTALYPGEPSQIELAISSRNGGSSSSIVSFSSSLEFLELESGNIQKNVTNVTARFRSPFSGNYEVKNLGVEIQGPLGLFKSRFEIPVSFKFTVYPRVVDIALTSLKILAKGGIGEIPINRPGIGTEFYDLRGYQRGDDYRKINWKATARTGEVVVVENSKEVSASYLLILDIDASNYFDRDRLASTFLQLANMLTSLRVRYDMIIHRAGEVDDWKIGEEGSSGDPQESLLFALKTSLKFAGLRDEELPEELLAAIPSHKVKSNQKMLEGKHLTLLSEIEHLGYESSQLSLRGQMMYQTLEKVLIRSNPSDVPSILYITGMFGSLAPIVELGSQIKGSYLSEFIVVNPTLPWIPTRDEETAMQAFAKYRRKLGILLSAGIEHKTGDPVSIANQIFSG